MPTPRVLLAPVTVTPTKPLTPSHLKGLLWTDVMFRATGPLADVTYRSSHTAYHPTEQTLGFWEYLDRTVGDLDYAGCSETQIGEWYVDYRQAAERVPFTEHRPYLDALEDEGWVHPASERILRLWSAHYQRLGLHDPGLLAHQPPGLSLAAALDRLGELGLLLDLRAEAGPVYLDLTRYGMPLRQLVAPDGRPNHLACALRDLLPLAAGHDEVVLLHDRELTQDYLLLQRALRRAGPAVHRVAIGRVPIGGQVRSARHGDWREHSVAALLDRAADADESALRLGARLYFIALQGRGDHESFRSELLYRCLTKAARLLSAGHPDRAAGRGELAGYLARHRGDHVHVDPYRLTASLLARHNGGPGRDLLEAVYT